MTTVSPSTESSISLNLWAPGPLLANAVAISIDHQSNVYVSQTSRRKSSYLDIREHWDWMIEDLALQRAADKSRFYLKVLSPKFSEQNEWLEDFNEDGSRDYKDLEVQKETVRRIWDEDKDGRADHSESFVEGFNDLLGGVAGGVLAHNGKIYVTANPSLWEVSDDNKDYKGDNCHFCSGKGKVGLTPCKTCKGEKRILGKQKLTGIKLTGKETKVEAMGHFAKNEPGKVGYLLILS
jgi:hypothetical protein